MSRSRRKTSIKSITTAKSEKKDKQNANRKLRRKIRDMLRTGYSGEFMMPDVREVSDVWSMRKDGKCYFDQKEFPQELRK